MANKAIVADHLLTTFSVGLRPLLTRWKQKTAARAGTLSSGPVDSLPAYRLTFYGTGDSHASAISAGAGE